VGRSLEELKGVPITDLFGPMGAQFDTHLSQVALTGRSVEAEDRLTVVKSEVWLKTSLVPLADVAPGFVLGVSRDISDSKRLEAALRTHAEEVERLATHDALTGFANRRAFMVALDRAVAMAQRGTTSAVLFTDVDCFKRCNDERGHTFGDDVLTSVAGRLGKEAREVDLVARIGGDEFAALLTGTDEAGALIVAKRMRESILALAAEIGIPIDLSVGVAEVTSGTNAVHIVSIADQRMYERKAAHHDTRVVQAGAGRFSGL
jgi:diguanylate cyclase (GGDEF)-like protein